MKHLLIIPLLAAASGLLAQDIVTSLQKKTPGQGTVTISQSAEIASLVGRKTTTTSENGKVIKTVGYRILLFAGNNSRQSRDEAYRLGSLAKEQCPDAAVYTMFVSPRWLCEFGDFRTVEEADAMMKTLGALGDFREMSIIKSQININLKP